MALSQHILARCNEAGIPLTPDAARTLSQFHLILVEWNRHMDLTAVLEEMEMVDRHYVDSLSALRIGGLLPAGASAVDVGSGAGFPGLPLAIARPDLKITLLDAQQKRVRFLQEAAAQLALSNVQVLHGRAEDVAHMSKYREQFDLALARAVAPLPVLLEYLLPFVKTGGSALCWKGPAVLQELFAGEKAAKLLGGALQAPIPTPIPQRDWTHLLLPCKKTGKTLRQYPRKAGLPGRKPLGETDKG